MNILTIGKYSIHHGLTKTLHINRSVIKLNMKAIFISGNKQRKFAFEARLCAQQICALINNIGSTHFLVIVLSDC